MSPAALERPRQVTLAAWMIIGGSVLVVVAVFEQVATLHRLETRRPSSSSLSEPPVDGLGLGLESALTIMRTVSMVAAGCAAAAAILGFHVLRRNRGARLGADACSPCPLFLSGVVSAASCPRWSRRRRCMLWLAAVARLVRRDRPAPSSAARARSRRRPAGRHLPPAAAARAAGPAAAPGLRLGPVRRAVPAVPRGPPQSATPRPHDAPPPPAAAVRPAVAAPPPARPGPRPTAVVVACIVTWVFSSLAVLLMGAHRAGRRDRPRTC